MLFGVLWFAGVKSKAMNYCQYACFYCSAAALIASCCILLNALYQISTSLKDLAHFMIN